MELKYKNQIKCPYCDWEDSDSWEFNEDSGTHTCGGCEKEFNVERHIEVTYSTSRIKCEEGKHIYQLESYFIHKRKYDKGWSDLPEAEWQYIRVEMCAECGGIEYIKIGKDEYENERRVFKISESQYSRFRMKNSIYDEKTTHF